jgi:hypothetical protein
MSRESCIIIRPASDATSEERQLIGLAIAMREPPFDYVEADGDFVVFVDAPTASSER